VARHTPVGGLALDKPSVGTLKLSERRGHARTGPEGGREDKKEHRDRLLLRSGMAKPKSARVSQRSPDSEGRGKVLEKGRK